MKLIIRKHSAKIPPAAIIDWEKEFSELLIDFDYLLTAVPLLNVERGVQQQRLTLLDMIVLHEPFYLSDGESYLVWDKNEIQSQALKIESPSRDIRFRFACAGALRSEFARHILEFGKIKQFEFQTQTA